MLSLYPGWVLPITVGRHAFGDQYAASELRADRPGKFEITFIPDDGSAPKKIDVYKYKSPGVGMAMYNTDEVRDHPLNHTRRCF